MKNTRTYLGLLFAILLSLRGNAQTFTFLADSVTGAVGTTVDVPVRARNFNQILSIQGTIQWNPGIATYSSMNYYGLPGMNIGNFGTLQNSSGRLSFSWDDGTLQGLTLADSTILFTIRFSVNGPANNNTAISFGNAVTPIEVVNISQTSIPFTSVPGNIFCTGTGGSCSISGLTALSQTACAPSTNTYTQQVRVTYSNAPASGQLQVNGQSFTITASPQTVTLTNLPANGLPVNVTAAFSASPTCSRTQNNLFTAPVSCGSTGTFLFLADSVLGQVGTFVDVPIRAKSFNQILSIQGTIEWNTPVITYNSITYYGLPAMASNNFGTSLTGSGKLSFSWDDASLQGTTVADSTILFTIRFNVVGANGTQSPVSFTGNLSPLEVVDVTQNPIANTTRNGNVQVIPFCSISALSAGTQSACNVVNNSYTQQVTVTYTNRPSNGSLVVNGQSFALGTSPQTVTLTNLNSDGLPVNVTANFSSIPGCSLTSTGLFTAPMGCSSNVFTFFADSVTGNTGTTVDVNVRVRNFSQILSIQGTLNWNASLASFHSLTYYGLSGMNIGNFGTSQTSSGRLSFSWDDVTQNGVTVPDSTIIFTVRYNLIGNGGTRTALTFGNQVTTMEVVNVQNNTINFSSVPGNINIIGACGLDSVTAGSRSSCNPSNNSYTQQVTLYYTNAPSTGNLVVNGQTFPIGTSPRTVTLTGLYSDGLPVNLTAYFSANPGCTITRSALFTAPAGCATNIFTLFADSVTGNSGTSVTVNIRVKNFRSLLSVQGTVGWNSSIAVLDTLTYFGLPSFSISNFGLQQRASGYLSWSWDDNTLNGLTLVDSTILFTMRFNLTGPGGNQTPVSFGNQIAPLEVVDTSNHPIVNQTVNGNIIVNGPCGITALAAGTQFPCNTGNNLYSQLVTVTFANAPRTGTLVVNGQSFPIGTSPQTVTLTNLYANGRGVDVSASFSAIPNCTLAVNNLFTAAPGCASVPMTLFADSVQGNPGTTVDVPVRVKQFNQILSIQGTMNWNVGVASFNSVSYYGLSGMGAQNFGLTQSGSGKIAFSWDDASLLGTTLADSTILFTLRFDLTGPGGSQTPLSFTNDIAAMEVTDVNSRQIYFVTTSGRILITGGCSILGMTPGGQTSCVGVGNSYDQTLTLTYNSAPQSGYLVVNGQTFSITGSPQTITLRNLYANGLPVDVTAYFSAIPNCVLTMNGLFTAPAMCGSLFTLFADTVTGATGSTVNVSFRPLNFDSILSMQGTLIWNPTVATFDSIVYTGGLPGMTYGNFGLGQAGTGQISYSWDDASLTGITLPDSTALFTIRFNVVGSGGSMTPVQFGNSITIQEVVDFNQNVITVDTNSGSITVTGGAPEILGQCVHPLGDSIRLDSVFLTGSMTASLMTPTNGTYAFQNLTSGGNYTVRPAKRNDVNRLNGVSSLDVVLVKRHVTGLTFFNSVWKILAADVNSSNSVSSLDAVLMQRFVVGLDTVFSGPRLWRFVPSDHVFADTTNPWTPSPPPSTRTYTNLTSRQTGQNFIGVKLGDVNNSWSSAIPKTDFTGEFPVGISTPERLTPQALITVPVWSSESKMITGYQFTLSWNHEMLEYAGLRSGTCTPLTGEQEALKGRLPVSWVEENGSERKVEKGEILFEVVFRVKVTRSEEVTLQVNSDYIRAEAYDENLDVMRIPHAEKRIRITTERPDCGNHTGDGPVICRTFPNPFREEIRVEVFFPTQTHAVISIVNELGETVMNQSESMDAGSHEIRWNGRNNEGELLPAGIYFIRITGNGQTATVKAILSGE